MKRLCFILFVLAALAVSWVCLTAKGADYHTFHYHPSHRGWSYEYRYAPGPSCYHGYYTPRYYGYYERPRYEFRYDYHHDYHRHRRHHQCR